MIKLRRRLTGYRQRRATMTLIKQAFDRILKAALLVIVLPALIVYAAGISGSLSYFTAGAQSQPIVFGEENTIHMFGMVEAKNVHITGSEKTNVAETVSSEVY